MPRIPRDARFDSTMALIRDPYEFVSKRCRQYRSDLFETRLMLRKAICMTGPEAAQVFYDESKVVRSGAPPGRIEKTLFGQGGVQGLDDEEHRHRKRLFMSLMSPEPIGQLAATTAQLWRTYAAIWETLDEVVLYDALHELLLRAICGWVGVPLAEAEIKQRTREITALFDAAGSIGPKHWRSRLARKQAERWIEGVVNDIRAGGVRPPEQSAAYAIAWHRDLHGKPLNASVAAVEVLNLIRPTVAVSVYITFVAHALHEHPESLSKLRAGDGDYPELFVQEVRRFYPFFPSVIGRAREDFEWNGYHFPRDRRLVLDLYGTNHDARTWDAPEEFRPERFRRWNGSAFNFIPQGGGDHNVNHRCPGEWITFELMKVALDVMANHIQYDVPRQELQIDTSRLPALPKSRFVIRNVRRVDA